MDAEELVKEIKKADQGTLDRKKVKELSSKISDALRTDAVNPFLMIAIGYAKTEITGLQDELASERRLMLTLAEKLEQAMARLMELDEELPPLDAE